MTTTQNRIRQAREKVIAGHTWLHVQIMQGRDIAQISQQKSHFLTIGGQRVTDIHENEMGLVNELQEKHLISFKSLEYTTFKETEKGYEFLWRKAKPVKMGQISA